MSRAARWLAGTAGVAAWLWYAARRNRELEPPPIRDLSGELIPERHFTFSDGERVSFVDVGEGPALLLVPGADGVKETWRFQVPFFARAHRVIAADLRSRVPAGADFDLLVRDLTELCDGLDAGPVALAGQSLGGSIAMRAAFLEPERVRALVLSNTLARVSYEHVGLNRSLLAPVAMATTRYLPTALARAAAHGWSRAGVWIYDDSPGAENVVDYALFTGPRTVRPSVSSRRVDLLRGVDLRPDLPDVRAPTLVVKGPRDSYVPPAWSREIARLIPEAEYVEVPGTGHCSHVSRPGAFNRLVADWLEAVGGASTDAAARPDEDDPSGREEAGAP